MGNINIILLLLFSMSMSNAIPINGRCGPKNHPGCLILWFLPGCPLAEISGVDPFEMYPWEELCRDYGDLAKHEVCEDYVEKTEEKNKKTDGRVEMFEAVPNKFSLSRKLETDQEFSVSRSRDDMGEFSITRE